MATPRRRYDAVVLENRPLCREHWRVRVSVGQTLPATQPGQFVQLSCRPPQSAIDHDRLLGATRSYSDLQQIELCEQVPLLRRPFSLAGRGDDAGGTWLDIIYRVVGVGTRWLSQLRAGQMVDLIGPLGRGFELPAGKSLGLLVGGGVGLPPMLYLAEALAKAGWQAVAFIGAQTADLLPVNLLPHQQPSTDGNPTRCVSEFARHDLPTAVTTDDGSLGPKGFITDALDRFLSRLSQADARRCVIFACGPEPMMRAAAALAASRDLACQVSLERTMACGLGTCQSCIVRIEDATDPHGRTADGRPWRYRLACTDGPVFDARQVFW